MLKSYLYFYLHSHPTFIWAAGGIFYCKHIKKLAKSNSFHERFAFPDLDFVSEYVV